MKNYDLYELREEGAEAGNMTALKPFALLGRARLIEEVVKFGFMCDWNDFKVGVACRLIVRSYRWPPCTQIRLLGVTLGYGEIMFK